VSILHRTTASGVNAAKYALSCSTLLAIGMAQPAWAADPAQASGASQTPDGVSVAEIVVTANKREQRLNDVGLTVAAMPADVLQTRQIANVADLAAVVPGLSFTTSATGQPVYTLRGVGFYDVALGAYQTVAVYTDQAPLPYGAMTRHAGFDLERIEVLKGPQGILFGENATAGSINYINAKPTDHLAEGGSITYGRFNEVDAEAYVSGPLADNLKARIAGRVETADGWQISNSRPGDTNGRVRNFMGRILLDYQPTDRLRLQMNLNGWIDKSDPQAAQYIGNFFQNPVVAPSLLNAPFSPQTPRAADWTPGDIHANNQFFQAFLRADYDVLDDVKLTTLTSYAFYNQDQGTDNDGLPISVLDYPSDIGRIHSFFQEVRLSNAASSRLRWVAGANFEKDTVTERVDEQFPQATAGTTLATIGYPIDQARFVNTQDVRTWATFGNVEYDVTHTVTIKGGLRYTSYRNQGYSCTSDQSGTTDQVGSFIYDVLLNGVRGRYQEGECFEVNGTSAAIGGVAPDSAGAVVETLREHNLSWRAGVDWKPERGVLFYAGVTKGYKAGGFPMIGATTVQQNLSYSQESVLDYEGGFKLSLLDRKLQLNGAGFYYKYDNEQLQSKANTPPFGIENVNLNIPKSSVLGFEVEADARPIRGLTINGAFTYLKAKVVEFTGLNATDIYANYAGYPLPYTPKYQYGVNAQYDFPLSQRLNGFVGGGVNYRSSTIAIIGGEINPPTAAPQSTCLSCLQGYALVDARVGVSGSNGRWRAWLWGKNLFNKYYWDNVTALNDVYVRYAGKPATYGITVSLKM
jgi:iron complex outermembrane recepter protein